MGQHSRAMEIAVGLFICLGVLAMFILTLRVSNLQTQGLGDTYQVTAKFDNIGGLRAGASVSMAGVQMGRVQSIVFDQTEYVAVVNIALSQQYSQLPADTSASILTAGLLGENYIGLEAGGDPEPLKNGDEIFITESALVLEQVIGQFLFSKAEEGSE